MDIPEPDYSDSDDDDQPVDAVDEEIPSELIGAKKLVNPCLESKEHKALRRELALNQKLYVLKLSLYATASASTRVHASASTRVLASTRLQKLLE